MARRKKLPPIHPGELLRDELNEIGVSLNELARALRVPINRISAIVNGKRAITVDTAMRLARYFGTSPQYWLNLQTAYDWRSRSRRSGRRSKRKCCREARLDAAADAGPGLFSCGRARRRCHPPLNG